MNTPCWRSYPCLLAFGLACCSSDNGGTAGDGGVDSGNEGGDGATEDGGTIGDRDGGDPDAVVLHDSSPDSWICDEMDFNIERVIPDMLLVLDRSGSMTVDDNWSTVRDAIYSVTEEMDESIWFGLMVFPAAQEPNACFNRTWHGQQVSENGCEPSRGPLVECAAGTAADIRSTLEPMEECGATPTAPTLEVAQTYLAELHETTRHPSYVLLATDGAPNCNMELDGSTCTCTATEEPTACAETNYEYLCLDDGASYAAIDDIRAAGMEVFVIGIAATEWGEILDEMASRGGTGSALMAEDPDSIEAAFEGIVGSIASCEFDMRAPDPSADPWLVNFYFDGDPVPMDGDDSCDAGWSWVDGNSRVVFCGDYCDNIMANEISEIRATFGCPTLI